jgi:putative DNA methylase
MTDYPKRLIEVDLPIKRISAHARREKSIRHGHISTLHIWWARRPLAACRAVLCAALWPDPADEHCPQGFREAAARLMQEFAFTAAEERSVADLCHPYTWGKLSALRQPESALDPANPDHLNFLRYLLLDFIADFSNWDASTEPHYLETARGLTQAAHEALGGLPGTRPLVVDPFAGGGAIPLEALRVGADAFASDLNPVAVLLNKVVLEYIPKYGQRLADEVRKWGQWVKEEAEKELAEFYPTDPDGATPIAYLWARTIQCEGPACGAEVPLMRSLWLAKRKRGSVALKMIPNSKGKRVDFAVIENVQIEDVGEGTLRRGSTTCPICGYTTPATSVRQQLRQRHGGTCDARLFAVAITRPGQQGRFYRLPTKYDLDAVREASAELERRKTAHTGVLSLTPDEPTPVGGGSGAGRAFSQRNYGMDIFENLFTHRQLLTLTTMARLVREVGDQLALEYEDDLASAVQTCLGMMLNKQADYLSSLCIWHYHYREKVSHTFSRHALPFVWDFVETVFFGSGSGNWDSLLNWMVMALEKTSVYKTIGQAERSSADSHPLPNDAAQCFFTDPPYYDAVPYADLSDFFYVWFKRSLGEQQPHVFGEALVPKEQECIVDEVKGKDRTYFERTMTQAMAEGRRVLAPDGVGLVVFAHKTTSGWEAQLQAMIDAGWTVAGSWPIDTEMGTRLRARDSAALASSIHIVCRPRENPDGSLRTDAIGEWRDVLDELPGRIHEWMPRLAQEGVVGADAIFACLGPALEIYSRYSRVERADGTPVPLGDILDESGHVVERGYLSYVWEAVSREALSMIFEGADTAGFEADARLTAMWLWTLSTAQNDVEAASNGKVIKSTGYTLEYDAARKIAQGLGAHLDRLGDLVQIKGDKARLLPVTERSKALFGKEGPTTPRGRKSEAQLSFFDEVGVTEEGSGVEDLGAAPHGATVLDRVHQAMLLFASGRGEALRRFLVEEGVGQEARFWRLAQALSALYPPQTDEKRWVDGVLARKKGLGF